MADKQDLSPELSAQIDELEDLVDKKSIQKRVSVVGDQVIPILDELVTPGEHYEERDLFHNEYDDERYNQLVEEVEEKLSHELDEIVNLLKGNLKSSILHELQDRMKNDVDSKDKD